MFKHLFTNPRTSPTRLFLTVSLGVCLILLALLSFRQPAPPAAGPAHNSPARAGRYQRAGQTETTSPTNRLRLKGADTLKYLQQPGEGQSLGQAITAARFGLQSQERGPFGESGAGYLGMSHDQNLNAWFAEDGVTVRPTVSEQERERAWHMDMRLKAYGYGNELVAAPPIVSRQMKGNRIEYERGENFGMRISAFEFRKDAPFNLQSAIQNAKFVEWYENRAEGIEQGFTLATRPEAKVAAGSDEPLRLVVSLNGDLRAHVKDEGKAIELTDASGKRALSYSKLTALDADRKQLAAHMEASADGGEIALVVDDRGASYPIVIDPIVASLEKILDAQISRQAGAQFGDAVAVDGDRAIVGAWLEDDFGGADFGAVYIFSRTGSTWNQTISLRSPNAHDECGYSVAISGNKAVFGCPGASNNTGRVFIYDFNSTRSTELIEPDRIGGDFFGASVAIAGGDIVIGAPFASVINRSISPHSGAVHFFQDDSYRYSYSQFTPNQQFGNNVALDGDTVLVGAPSALSSTGKVIALRINGGSGGSFIFQGTLTASDGAAGDLFGTGVAISGNTALIGAPTDDDKGTDAGAAYVFVRDATGQWNQQQKLTASDGKANDIFGYNAVAIQGHTIVVGARRQDGLSSNPSDNRGAAYIFTRNINVWTQQTTLGPAPFFGLPGDEYGTSVGISGNTVIVSAPHAAALDGTLNSGTTYVYRLDCTPPYDSSSESNLTDGSDNTLIPNRVVCPGQNVNLQVGAVTSTNAFLSYQWRKNGVNIPGATSFFYRLNNASASDVGSYDAFVSNSCGGEFSRPATLGVHSFNIIPASQNFGASGSNGIVNLTATGSCPWTAVSNSSAFITVTSGASGSGNGTVGFAVAANPNAAQRTGTITIAGKTFSVTQDGTGGTLVSNVQFSALNYSAGEGSNSATITVTRTGDTSGTATVDFATSDLVAQQRTDYTITAGTLTFSPGQTSKTFDVLIVDDLYVEGSETLNLTLSNPTGGAVLGSPSTAVLTITDNDSGSPTTNPLDNADERFFVRLQFYDFLSRLPDQGGFDFWAGQITQCGTNQVCIKSKRLDVSNAFFFELEYQQTGAYVFRLYRAAFGNNQPFPNPDNSNQTESKKLPSYAVFARDRARVVGGSSLAQSQLDLANAFVARAEFLARYPASQSGPTFVDALLATIRNDAGADLTSQRTALINLFNTGGRGAVLYRLADDNLPTNPINNRAFIDAEYNRAFVATQYFGYLRRDSDIGGFLFWVGQVNSGPLRDETKQHAMVCAFTTAAEYQQRFSSVITHSNAECQQ